MIFSSPIFLFFFIPVFFLYWYVLPLIAGGDRGRARHFFLLCCSYVFYMASVPVYGLLIFSSTAVDYVAGRVIGYTHEHAQMPSARRIRMIALVVSLVLNLGLLGYFKYTDFFIAQFIQALEFFHPNILNEYERYSLLLHLVLPVGISFFTFQSMSYTIDAYRGVIPPEKDFIRFALFVSFFPQLVAGPIVTAKEFLPQLDEDHRLSVDEMLRGARWFALGYFKKVVLADNVAFAVERLYDPNNISQFGADGHWLGAIAFWVQVYCDFSGYSDMAWGTAIFLGFRLPENFRLPYLSRSVTEHWQRWHISLIRWNRDYLYFPLGGNRVSFWRHKFNIWFTMFAAGVWHGANWTFAIWGAIHGAILAIESAIKEAWRKRWERKQAEKGDHDLQAEHSRKRLDGRTNLEPVRYFSRRWPIDIIQLCATSFVTIFFGSMFRAQSISDWWEIAKRMLGVQTQCSIGAQMVPCLPVTRSLWEPVAWCAAAVIAGHIIGFYLFEKGKFRFRVPRLLEVALLAVFTLIVIQIGSRELQAFIYFVF